MKYKGCEVRQIDDTSAIVTKGARKIVYNYLERVKLDKADLRKLVETALIRFEETEVK